MSDYTMCSRCNEKPAAICTCNDTKWVHKDGDYQVGHGRFNRWHRPCPECQQPTAGEYKKRTIENTEVCPCGNIFFEDDDYDTLGSESGVICPNCGNEKFQTVKDRLDRAESINKDLLEVSENLRGFVLTAHLAEVREKVNYTCPKSCATCYLLNESQAAIARANKE